MNYGVLLALFRVPIARLAAAQAVIEDKAVAKAAPAKKPAVKKAAAKPSGQGGEKSARSQEGFVGRSRRPRRRESAAKKPAAEETGSRQKSRPLKKAKK